MIVQNLVRAGLFLLWDADGHSYLHSMKTIRNFFAVIIVLLSVQGTAFASGTSIDRVLEEAAETFGISECQAYEEFHSGQIQIEDNETHFVVVRDGGGIAIVLEDEGL